MTEMIEVFHPITGDTASIPEGALETQRLLGWEPASETKETKRPSPKPTEG